MPRRTRVLLDGIPLHIVQRGHNRESCFFCDGDRRTYLNLLGDALAESDCALHAYVLMTNHVHLLVTPKRAEAVPGLFISLGRRYVQYINRRHERTGTLWDSRYRSSLVQEDAYLFACHRYIEMNPVRAGIAGDPAQYYWSSYRANGLGQLDVRVTPHPLYQDLGRSDRERQAAYRALFHAGLDPEIDGIRLALRQSQPLGNAGFHAKVAQLTGICSEARPRGRPRSCPLVV